MLDKLKKKSAPPSEKPTLNKCVFKIFAKVSESTDRFLTIEQATCSNNWDQQLQKLSNLILFCGQAQDFCEPQI